MFSLKSTACPLPGSSPSNMAGHRRLDRSQRDTLSPKETPSLGLRRMALCNGGMWGIVGKKETLSFKAILCWSRLSDWAMCGLKVTEQRCRSPMTSIYSSVVIYFLCFTLSCIPYSCLVNCVHFKTHGSCYVKKLESIFLPWFVDHKLLYRLYSAVTLTIANMHDTGFKCHKSQCPSQHSFCFCAFHCSLLRWIKFEEKVEKGGERWSKPHVATLSLHSLMELKACIEKGTIMLDLEASTLPQVVGKWSWLNPE